MRRIVWTLPLFLLSAFGCVTPIGASGGFSIPPDAGQQCAQQCASIGMGLSAVAIMANNVGCVCQGRTGGPVAALSAAPAGMATISMMRTHQQNQQNQQRHYGAR